LQYFIYLFLIFSPADLEVHGKELQPNLAVVGMWTRFTKSRPKVRLLSPKVAYFAQFSTTVTTSWFNREYLQSET